MTLDEYMRPQRGRRPTHQDVRDFAREAGCSLRVAALATRWRAPDVRWGSVAAGVRT